MQIIRLIVIFTVFLNCILGTAQELNNLQEQSGFLESKKSGMAEKLMRWKNFGRKSDDALFQNPQERSLLQLGIRPESISALADSYEFYGGQTSAGNNIPYDMATDAQGNTYITGASSSESQPAGDFFTMKISPLGAILWQARIPAAKYSVEYGMLLLLDADGNVIVTGMKWNGSDMDIRTVKYSAEGLQLWTAQYSGSNQGIDAPTAMTLGLDGSICIAGISWSGSSIEYLTLKYASTGSLLWEARESAPGNDSWNETTAIAADAVGNVIVTGYSPSADGWLNYHTVKYSPSGMRLWARDYNYASTDPENPAETTNSIARSVTADAENNIYITGVFDTYLGRIGTVKYNAGGDLIWTATYKTEGEKTEGWQIALKGGRLYVAGSHNGNFSNNGTVLLSYETNGTQNWVRETTDLIDAANVELLFDAQGNPLVAAKGMTPGAEEWLLNVAARAKKYSVLGELLGEAAFVIDTGQGTASMGSMAGMGLDNESHVIFTVNSYYSAQGSVFETVKAGFGQTAPAPDWNAVYANAGAPNASMLHSFSDGTGNTFSTGQYHSFADGVLNPNYFLVKHSAQGSIAWQSVYNTENGNPAEGIIGRADEEGNAFVCLLPQPGEPIKVKKLSPSGQEMWEAEILLANPQVRILEIGSDGSLYLGGVAYENEASTRPSFMAVKISAAGEELWRAFVESSNAAATIYEIAAGKVSAAGDFLMTGGCGTGNFLSQNVNLTVLKIDSDGTVSWQTAVTVAGGSSTGTDLLLSSDGTVYTNGFLRNNDTYAEDIITAKIAADGTLQWTRIFGDAEKNERSYTVRQFSDGAVAVIGYNLDIEGNISNSLIKYDSQGNQLWVFESENMRYFNGFHIDGADKCYIMDQIITSPFPRKIYTSPFPIASLITVSASGSGEEEFFVGNEYAEFYGKELVAHADGRLLLAGNIANESFYNGLHFFETQHDGPLGTGTHEAVIVKSQLLQNYPNPAAGSTSIPFYLIKSGKVSIKLYSIEGQLIGEIANDTFRAGVNTLIFDSGGLAPGTYFYQMTAGDFKQARKMVVAR